MFSKTKNIDWKLQLYMHIQYKILKDFADNI